MHRCLSFFFSLSLLFADGRVGNKFSCYYIPREEGRISIYIQAPSGPTAAGNCVSFILVDSLTLVTYIIRRNFFRNCISCIILSHRNRQRQSPPHTHILRYIHQHQTLCMSLRLNFVIIILSRYILEGITSIHLATAVLLIFMVSSPLEYICHPPRSSESACISEALLFLRLYYYVGLHIFERA